MDFSQIAILLSVAGIFGLIAKVLRQPLMVGYLFAGIILSYFGIIRESESLNGLGQVGVALLLFLLGLEMKISELPSIGKVALITGLGQIFITSILGFAIASFFGFPFISAVYVAIALTFSSTIIVIKLLSEKKDLGSLYGRVSVGLLLVQDFVAILFLMFLAGLGGGSATGIAGYIFILVKAALLFAFTWYLSKKFFPYIYEKLIAQSQELLFIVSIAWALGFAALAAGPLGLTLEIGGFLAGIALSNLPEHLEIASRSRPLRDFFLTIFFLFLGTKLIISGSLAVIIVPAIIFSIFVLVSKPLVVMVILGLLGYKKRTAFLTGLTVAQISEFSLIIIAMGHSMMHVEEQFVSLVVLVGVITMTVSTYLITGAEKIYEKTKLNLGIFEKKNPKEKAFDSAEKSYQNHIVIIGSDRTGTQLVNYFKNKNVDFIVIDFNPDVYKRLTAQNVPVVFGDVTDKDILENAGLGKAGIIISTTSSLTDDLVLLEYLRNIGSRGVNVFTASTKHDAVTLYEKGADFVIVPDITAGEQIRNILRLYKFNKLRLKKAGKFNFERLIAT